jgi:hypothetical protein
VNLLQLSARLHRQVTLGQQCFHPSRERPCKLRISLKQSAAPFKQRPQRMGVQVSQRFAGNRGIVKSCGSQVLA